MTARVQAQSYDLEQSGAFSSGLTAFVGKLTGVYGALALVLHFLANPEHALQSQLSRATAEGAERLAMSFLLPHAMEFFRLADDKSDGDSLRSIASYLLTSTLTRFRAADLSANVRELRGLGSWDMNRKLAPLTAGGWLNPEDQSPTCRAWNLTPGLRERFAAEAERERARRERVHAQLVSLQKGTG